MLVMDDSKTLEYCYLIVFYKILIWAGQCEIMMVWWDAELPNKPRESHTQRATEPRTHLHSEQQRKRPRSESRIA